MPTADICKSLMSCESGRRTSRLPAHCHTSSDINHLSTTLVFVLVAMLLKIQWAFSWHGSLALDGHSSPFPFKGLSRRTLGVKPSYAGVNDSGPSLERIKVIHASTPVARWPETEPVGQRALHPGAAWLLVSPFPSW